MQRKFFAFHRKPEVKLFPVFFVFQADITLYFCKLDDNLIFPGKMADSRHDFQGIAQVNAENTVKKSDDKAEFNMIGKPVKPFKDPGVNQKVVDGA